MVKCELGPGLATTIEHLAARWVRADRQILRHLFPLLAEGHPVPVNRLVQASGATSESVERALAGGRVEVDDDGDIIQLYGVTLSQTLHRIESEHTVLFACCALVSHVVPRLLTRRMRVTSTDPVTGDSVRLLIAPGGLLSVEPESAMASMIVTDEIDLEEDAPLYFCDHVHHFTTRSAAAEFIERNPNRYEISLSELDAAAERLYSAVWR